MVALLARMGQREWAIIAIVLAILLAVGWYFSFTQPLQNSIPAVESKITELTSDRDKGRAAQRALPVLRSTIADLESQQQAFLRELPPSEQLGRVFTDLAQEANESGVTIKSINRGSGDSQGVTNVRATSLALQIESPFAGLYRFLQRLEKFQRFATVSGLTLTLGSEATSNPQINTSLTMTVYTYTGPGSGIQAAPTDQTGQTPPAQGTQPAQPGGKP